MKLNKPFFKIKIKDRKKFIQRLIVPTLIILTLLIIGVNHDKITLFQHRLNSKNQMQSAEKMLKKYQKKAKELALKSANDAIDKSDLVINEDGTVTMKLSSDNGISVSNDQLTFKNSDSSNELIKLRNEYEDKKKKAVVYSESKNMVEANKKIKQLYEIKSDESLSNMELINDEVIESQLDEKTNIENGEIVYPNDKEKAYFMKKSIETAKIVAKKNDLLPSVMVAQAIVESNWGQSELTKSNLNYFGVKYKGSGNYSEWSTMECYDGVNFVQIVDKFQIYNSMEESFQSNADILRNVSMDNGKTKYYSGAWLENVKDHEYPYQKASNALQGKYATSPIYGSTLINVIQTYGLNYLDGEVLK